jgi:hypothetical protein
MFSNNIVNACNRCSYFMNTISSTTPHNIEHTVEINLPKLSVCQQRES